MSSFSKFYSLFKTFNHWPIQLGEKTQETQPAMKKYISGSYNSNEIIDPQKSLYHLFVAKKVIEETYKQGGKILFFTNQPDFCKIVETFFPKNNPQLILLETKWIPGLLTNWSGFNQSLAAFESREFFPHQRNTFLRLQKRYRPFLESKVDGKQEAPDLIVCLDANDSIGAIQEAFRLKIPSIGIANTNIKINPSKITYPIPGNTRSFRSLYFFSRILVAGLCKLPKPMEKETQQPSKNPNPFNNKKILLK